MSDEGCLLALPMGHDPLTGSALQKTFCQRQRLSFPRNVYLLNLLPLLICPLPCVFSDHLGVYAPRFPPTDLWTYCNLSIVSLPPPGSGEQAAVLGGFSFTLHVCWSIPPPFAAICVRKCHASAVVPKSDETMFFPARMLLKAVQSPQK